MIMPRSSLPRECQQRQRRWAARRLLTGTTSGSNGLSTSPATARWRRSRCAGSRTARRICTTGGSSRWRTPSDLVAYLR